MPLVTIKAPEGVFDTDQQRRMLAAITEALIDVEGEAIRGKTWVLYEEIPPGHWAIGGQLIGTPSSTDAS